MDPSKFVKQKGDSDCLNCCIESLTGISSEDFPVLTKSEYENITQKRRDELVDWQDGEMSRILKQRGWSYSVVEPKDVVKGWSIGCGPSPRGPWLHAVLCLNGIPKFDPNPSNDMLGGEIEHLIVIERIIKEK